MTDQTDDSAVDDDAPAVDPVVRYDELTDRVRMLAVPADAVVSRWAVVAVTAAVLALLIAILAGVVGITLDTNRAVSRQVEPLQARNAELEQAVADMEFIIQEAVAGLQLQAQMLRDAGIEPPEIVLLPPDMGD